MVLQCCDHCRFKIQFLFAAGGDHQLAGSLFTEGTEDYLRAQQIRNVLFEAAEFDAPVRQRVGWENARRLFGLD